MIWEREQRSGQRGVRFTYSISSLSLETHGLGNESARPALRRYVSAVRCLDSSVWLQLSAFRLVCLGLEPRDSRQTSRASTPRQKASPMKQKARRMRLLHLTRQASTFNGDAFGIAVTHSTRAASGAGARVPLAKRADSSRRAPFSASLLPDTLSRT